MGLGGSYAVPVDMPAGAIRLAETLLAPALPQRWLHTIGVIERAKLAAPSFSSRDGRTLVAAAALHDIGYSPLVKTTGFHALDGALYLRKRGFGGRVCGLVAHHSCAYKEAELRGLSGHLAEWIDENTAVRDALWWADMTTSPGGRAIGVLDRIEEIQKRYGPEDLVTFFIRQARPELVAAVQRTEELLDSAGIIYIAK